MRISCKTKGLTSFLYFAGVDDRVKIGTSASPADRMGSLKATPLLVVHGSFKAEKFVHERFAHLRTSGEWFRMHSDLVSFIADARAEKATCFICREGLQSGGTLRDAIDEATIRTIVEAIEAVGDNNTKVAKLIGSSRSSVISLRKRYEI